MAALAVALVLSAGCAISKPPPPPRVNLNGFPPAFREGYGDGCQSARDGALKRDEARFAKEAQYATGWRDGFDVCRKRPAS
ncbi:MAG TPA: hypothetical protein VMH26_13860 [Burkholderiales bacterium]|nr:hypothetical protein [Burkholderiales bacterium]